MNDYSKMEEKLKKYSAEFYEILADVKGDFEFKEEFLFNYVGNILSTFICIKNRNDLVTLNKIVEKDIKEKFKNLQEGVIRRIKKIEAADILTNSEGVAIMSKVHNAFEKVGVDVENCIKTGNFTLTKEQTINLQIELKKIGLPTGILCDFIDQYNSKHTIH